MKKFLIFMVMVCFMFSIVGEADARRSSSRSSYRSSPRSYSAPKRVKQQRQVKKYSKRPTKKVKQQKQVKQQKNDKKYDKKPNIKKDAQNKNIKKNKKYNKRPNVPKKDLNKNKKKTKKNKKYNKSPKNKKKKVYKDKNGKKISKKEAKRRKAQSKKDKKKARKDKAKNDYTPKHTGANYNNNYTNININNGGMGMGYGYGMMPQYGGMMNCYLQILMIDNMMEQRRMMSMLRQDSRYDNFSRDMSTQSQSDPELAGRMSQMEQRESVVYNDAGQYDSNVQEYEDNSFGFMAWFFIICSLLTLGLIAVFVIKNKSDD